MTATLNDRVAQDPVLWDDWHPVAIASQIVQGAITPTRLLDLPLALWRDSAGQVHAWEDRCPHRGTPFSLGAVEGDSVRCAYHGWRFGSDGRCTRIPALPALGEAVLKGRATTFAVQERHGLVWACLGTPPACVAPFPEGDDADLRKVWCGPYEVHSSGPRIVDNFLDIAHFAFVHEGILGAQDQAALADYTVEAFDEPGYGCGIRARQCRAWQPQASRAAAGGAEVEYGYRVVRPLSAILTKGRVSGGGPCDAIALFLQPLSETHTRVWIVLALTDHESSDDALRQFQDTIFLQDLPILESQRPQRLPLIAGAEVSVASDRMSLAYRGYLKRQRLRYSVLRED
ncbi:MAG: aromatic ring-hydroxylating dioxygenase subunit alpha [Massilia sp.]|nr:aromatic ring-hydroxylating dioxygenase subunit alpha [Massilia sp.]